MSATNIPKILMQNIKESLTAEIQLDKAMTWGKSVSGLPIFTSREINLDLRKCSKLKWKSVSKTSVRGRLLKYERFLPSESIFLCQSLMQSKYEERIRRCSKQHPDVFQGNVAIAIMR